MNKKYLSLSILFFLFSGCSAITNLLTKTPDVSVKKEFDGNGIAVFNFTRIGALPNDIGRLTADKLSDALFILSRFNVIERSRVNNVQSDLNVTSTESLSSEQILKLGQNLKANYLVLGRIHCISSDDFTNQNDDKQLNISFRIISVANQDIVGVASYSCNFNKNIADQIQEMITKMVVKISE